MISGASSLLFLITKIMPFFYKTIIKGYKAFSGFDDYIIIMNNKGDNMDLERLLNCAKYMLYGVFLSGVLCAFFL
jgi:hypothetical protein